MEYNLFNQGDDDKGKIEENLPHSAAATAEKAIYTYLVYLFIGEQQPQSQPSKKADQKRKSLLLDMFIQCFGSLTLVLAGW